MRVGGKALRTAVVALVLLLGGGCGGPWNDPYPYARPDANTLYASFQEQPRHLDPARAYSSDEYTFIGPVYEPPLQYAYLERPYQLVPLTATRVPKPHYLDAQGDPLGPHPDPDRIAYSVYTIHLRHGIRYQPHPAFAKGPRGKPRYLHLTASELSGYSSITDFPHTGTRELVASDYVYEIKRLADPHVHSPIFSLMQDHIVGFKAFAKRVTQVRARREEAGKGAFVDLSRIPMKGAQATGRYTFRIEVKGRYPQLRYWLAMPFFAPVPPEVARFYSQKVLRDRNLTLDQYPVGTGAYMLSENNPNRRMVLVQNPNFHHESYPDSGMPGDRKAGLLKDAGKPLPFIHRVVFSLEKENIPYWNKFLQGYYDMSGISSDSFDQAINIGSQGGAHLTRSMKAKGMQLKAAAAPTIFYMGFNMLDPLVGGYSERARKLRQAISIAVNYESFIAIFLNGRGIAAQGPIPPGIFGHQGGRAGMDPYVYQWKSGHAVRKPMQAARQLLARAGYPGGVSAKTGQPLLLHLDISASGPEDKARLDWYRKQFDRLGVQLVIRNTSYNRFQQKMADGNAQIFVWGWNADYPDPQNFLSLLYGPNGKAKYHGENVANYHDPEFDRLYQKMRAMPDGPKRLAIIRRMVHIAQRDAPWIWGFYPENYTLYQSWLHNAKPNMMANNTLKYLRLDPRERARDRDRWNHPVLWPLWAVAGVLALLVVPGVVTFLRRERRGARRK
ncbi:MAG TPA: ABC transporter substrate-binding protein [Gammaproteobacteria bacterium]|nr:ABC transporter substrate-binding protein [Gammaproteobacteria bacterium]